MLRPTAAKRSRYLPRIECLEERAVPSATPLFQDAFNDNSFDSAEWVSGKTDAEGNPIAVRERNQRLEFTGPGSVATNAEFAPSEDEPLEITGVWHWAPTVGLVGSAQVLTRAGSGYVMSDGVEFRAEPGVGMSIRLWQGHESTLLTSAAVKIDVGDTFRFRVRDNGLNVSFALMEIGGDGVAIALAAETDAVSDANHILFRSGSPVFSPVARLALDDVLVTDGTPSGPAPTPSPVVTVPPGSRPVVLPAIPLDVWVDESPDGDDSPSARESAPRVKVRRGKLRRSRGGKLRQTITLLNTGAGAVTDLRLAFTRLPKNARVRIAGDEWVSAAQAARGVYLGDRDSLLPGESVTVEVEFANVAAQTRLVTRVLGSLAAADDGFGKSDSSRSGAASSAVSIRDPDE